MTEPKKFTDRIGDYLMPYTEEYIFDELSEAYLEKTGMKELLLGVSVPIKKTELTGLTNLKIARNMADIIGCDINFRFRDNYIGYIIASFGKDFVKPLINEGVERAADKDFDHACICFRASMLIDPESSDALYCYARACKDCYESGEGEEYIGRYKAESLESFEKLTLKEPDFDMGFYFLGYAYLNLGLYVKAKLTWNDFMRLSSDSDDGDKAKMRDEISEWLAKLEEPIKIEAAYNLVLSGKFAEGLDALSKYADDERFNKWWPLWYYMGIAAARTGFSEDAEVSFKKVLELSPSNTDAMKELAQLYQKTGDEVKANKYLSKIELVKQNAEAYKAEKNKSFS